MKAVSYTHLINFGKPEQKWLDTISVAEAEQYCACLLYTSTIQAATYGHFVATALGMGEVGEAICMVLSAIAMGVFAFYGVKAITILGLSLIHISLYSGCSSSNLGMSTFIRVSFSADWAL